MIEPSRADHPDRLASRRGPRPRASPSPAG